jgi:Flp pilus assembly pilin Flp
VKKTKNHNGQAVIEYLLLFGFSALFAMAMFRSLTGFVGEGMQSLAFALSRQLSTGICSEYCYMNNFKNMKETP